jgi:predicted kinase
MSLVLVTGPPASGKTTLARPLAHLLGLPLLGKDTVKEALLDTLGTGDRAGSRRLGAASYTVLLALARQLSAVMLDANFYPTHAPALLQACRRPIEVFCRCPAAEVERRFTQRAPAIQATSIMCSTRSSRQRWTAGWARLALAVRCWRSTPAARPMSRRSRPGSASNPNGTHPRCRHRRTTRQGDEQPRQPHRRAPRDRASTANAQNSTIPHVKLA